MAQVGDDMREVLVSDHAGTVRCAGSGLFLTTLHMETSDD